MTYWLLSRKVSGDWFPVALYLANDTAIEAGLAWERAGYEIAIKTVSVAPEPLGTSIFTVLDTPALIAKAKERGRQYPGVDPGTQNLLLALAARLEG